MMTDASLQQIVQHQTVNFYDSNNVQLGKTNTIHCHQTNHLKQDVDRMKNEIQQLKLNNETQADEIQLKSRMNVMEIKTGAKKTNKNIFKKKDDMIELNIINYFLKEFDMGISRDKTVDELEKMIQEERRKKYGRDRGVYICYIYSNDFKQEKYNDDKHNKHLPLSNYHINHGDIVYLRY